MSLIKIWKNKGKILEGITNSIFTSTHVEEIANERKKICEACPKIDTEGSSCTVPGTQPCCSLCGCCLHFKQRALSASCDDKRWDAILSQEEEDILNDHLNSK